MPSYGPGATAGNCGGKARQPPGTVAAVAEVAKRRGNPTGSRYQFQPADCRSGRHNVAPHGWERRPANQFLVGLRNATAHGDARNVKPFNLCVRGRADVERIAVLA
jgi:hypothetical protein